MNQEQVPPLRILSIYLAPDGEANAWHQGTWTVFVRTAGCTVGCRWCDTKYSWSAKRGRDYSVAELTSAIQAISQGCFKVTLTGGEPLEQPRSSLHDLFEHLLRLGYVITVETAGTEPTGWLRDRGSGIALVLDYKLPSAQATRPPLPENFYNLREPHVVKFVVKDERDYRTAIDAIKVMREEMNCRARLVLSPMNKVGKEDPGFTYAQWVDKMKQDQLPRWGVGLNLQLHKVIYPSNARDEEMGGLDYSDIRKTGA